MLVEDVRGHIGGHGVGGHFCGRELETDEWADEEARGEIL